LRLPFGVGVDRVDYTKGLLERFNAIERFLEWNPTYQRRFTFVQIGAPSRTDIERYKDFLAEVSAEVERINARFQTGAGNPSCSSRGIIRTKKSRAITTRLLSVWSLAARRNESRAKEFVAAREDERGALILSTFAGRRTNYPMLCW